MPWSGVFSGRTQPLRNDDGESLKFHGVDEVPQHLLLLVLRQRDEFWIAVPSNECEWLDDY